MEKKFTQNDIIRDLYNEADASEQIAIQKERLANSGFAADYTSFKQAKDSLDSIKLNAPSFAIQNILNYSLKSKLETKLG